MKKVTAVFLTSLIMLTAAFSVWTSAADITEQQIDDAITGAFASPAGTDSFTPAILADTFGGADWLAINLAAAGINANYNDYVANRTGQITSDWASIGISAKARMAIGLAAAGADPANIGGHNLIEAVYNDSTLLTLGSNTLSYALMALTAKDYEIPDNAVNTINGLIEKICSLQLNDGGFSWDMAPGATIDVDTTSMVMYALGRYYKQNANVKTVLDKAVTAVSLKQATTGGYIGDYDPEENACTLADVITGLCVMGIDPETDARFVKPGGNALSALMSYKQPDGSFDDDTAYGDPSYTTTMSIRALLSVKRLRAGECGVFDLRGGRSLQPTMTDQQLKQKTDALPQTLSIDDKQTVLSLRTELSLHENFDGKAAIAKKLDEAMASIAEMEDIVKKLDEDIWNTISPENVKLSDKAAILALKQRYDQLSEANKKYVLNANDITDALAVIAKLEKVPPMGDNSIVVLMLGLAAVSLLGACTVKSLKRGKNAQI